MVLQVFPLFLLIIIKETYVSLIHCFHLFFFFLSFFLDHREVDTCRCVDCSLLSSIWIRKSQIRIGQIHFGLVQLHTKSLGRTNAQFSLPLSFFGSVIFSNLQENLYILGPKSSETMSEFDYEPYQLAKEQIAQLEAEMAEFRMSSRELEMELEMELEESEERHKQSQTTINNLTIELDQWKVCIQSFTQNLLKTNKLLGKAPSFAERVCSVPGLASEGNINFTNSPQRGKPPPTRN